MSGRIASNPETDARFVAEALFYERREGGAVRCSLCPRACVIAPGERGHCGVRENRGGALYTLVYGRLCSVHADPIEKKPLFHFLPGELAFSIATAGCNVRCRFCQNWEIAQARPEELPAQFLSPSDAARLARESQCAAIAYTYTEPTIFAEYAMDVADAGRAAGLRSLAVSNGYIGPEAIKEFYGRMDAVKIDLKSFSEAYYKEIVGAQLKPVLAALTALKAMGKWVEIVYLLIPGGNDDDAELTAMARWVKTNLGAEVPLHFSRFYPQYKMLDRPPTPVESLDRARAIALAEGLHYVYIGNVPGHAAQNTVCPQCSQLLVERAGFTAGRVLIREGRCPGCGHEIPGLWRA
jgi:pyruvate formate lyase activating enzyme